LIDNICSLILGYINGYKARSILFRARKKESMEKGQETPGYTYEQPSAAAAFFEQA
jgi:hypothetical protein